MSKNDDSANNIVPLKNLPNNGQSGDSNKRKRIPFELQSIVSNTIGGLIYTIILAIIAFGLKFYAIPEQLNDISKRVGTLEVSLTAEVNNRVTMDSQIQNQILMMALSPNLLPTNNCKEAITQGYNNWSIPHINIENQVTENTLVAYLKGTDEQYSANQLAEHKILLPYTSDNQEVYFYGQFSESGQWDGNCITNIYVNDKLTMITDAIYDNGRLLQCKQIYSYTLNSGKPVWAFSDQTLTDVSGETWLYERTAENEYTKDFTFDTITTGRIFTADSYRHKISGHLYAYYYGNISDNCFNDTTGKAYMIYFFEDGSVRLLYCGNFVNGSFNDSTGNAWCIVRNAQTSYMYFRGTFRNGVEVHDDKEVILLPPLSLEQIDEILGDRSFNFPLKWFAPEVR